MNPRESILEMNTRHVTSFPLTLHSCSRHGGGVEAELHGQTDSSGKDATNLSDQHWFNVMEGDSRQHAIQSLLSVSVDRWSAGKL